MIISKPDFPTKGCGHRGARLARHQRKGRSEAGSTKPGCKTTWLARYACKRSGAVRDPLYASIMQSIDKRAGRVKPTETTGLGRRGALRPHIAAAFTNWLDGYMGVPA